VKTLSRIGYTKDSKITLLAGQGVTVEPNTTIHDNYHSSPFYAVDTPCPMHCGWPDIRSTLGRTDWSPCDIPVSIKQWNFLLKAAAKRDVRYYLNGLHLDFINQAIVATDGHRLHYVSDCNMFNLHQYQGQGKEGMIIPIFAASWIVKGAKKTDTIKLLRFEKPENVQPFSHALICGEKAVFFDPVDGNFPAWQRVVNGHNSMDTRMFSLTFDPDMLRESIKLLGLKRNKCLISLRFDTSRQQSYIKYPSMITAGESSEFDIECKFDPDVKFNTRINAAFNLWYVMDSIHGLKQPFTLTANTGTGSSFTLPDDPACHGVIMGMRE